MNSACNRRRILVGLAAFSVGLAGPLPLLAQSEGEGGSGGTSMLGAPQHAEVGTLAAVGHFNDRVVLEYPHIAEYPGTERPSYRSFAANAKTIVQGLGKVAAVSDIPADAWGRVVVVTFTRGTEEPVADRLTFPVATKIRATEGTIRRLDTGNKTLSLLASNDQEQLFSLGTGTGVQVDGDHGLLDVSDLRVGEKVTVYYAQPSVEMPWDAYLIFAWN